MCVAGDERATLWDSSWPTEAASSQLQSMPLSKGDFLILSAFVLMKIFASGYKLVEGTIIYNSNEAHMHNLSTSTALLKHEMGEYEREFEFNLQQRCGGGQTRGTLAAPDSCTKFRLR
jgi:hypothetical protein